MRILQVHLTYLAIGTPTNVAGPRILQIRVTNGLKPSICVKSRSQLVRQAFVLDEAVLASGSNCLFVMAFRVQFSAFQARNLGAHERRSGEEIRRAIFGPKR